LSHLLISARQPAHATRFVVISLLPLAATAIQQTRSVREVRLAGWSTEVGREQVFPLKTTTELENAQGVAGNRRSGCLAGFGLGSRGLRLFDRKQGQDERRQNGRRQDERRQNGRRQDGQEVMREDARPGRRTAAGAVMEASMNRLESKHPRI